MQFFLFFLQTIIFFSVQAVFKHDFISSNSCPASIVASRSGSTQTTPVNSPPLTTREFIFGIRGENTDDPLEDSDGHIDGADAIKMLPDEQSKLIKMTYYEDKSHSIIAKELKMPLGTVKSRIRLASSRLKKLLEGTIHD